MSTRRPKYEEAMLSKDRRCFQKTGYAFKRQAMFSAVSHPIKIKKSAKSASSLCYSIHDRHSVIKLFPRSHLFSRNWSISVKLGAQRQCAKPSIRRPHHSDITSHKLTTKYAPPSICSIHVLCNLIL